MKLISSVHGLASMHGLVWGWHYPSIGPHLHAPLCLATLPAQICLDGREAPRSENTTCWRWPAFGRKATHQPSCIAWKAVQPWVFVGCYC